MNALIPQILALLPVFLASPTMYAGMLVVMSSGKPARARSFAALIGNVVTVIVIGFALIEAGSIAAGPRVPTTTSGAIDLAIGFLLIYLGIRRLFLKPKEKTEKEKPHENDAATEPQFVKYVGVGVLLTVTNPTSLASYLTAAKLTIDAHVDKADQIIAMSLATFCFSLPILLPLMLMIVSPGVSEKFLRALDTLFARYGRYIIAALLIGLGLYLAAKGKYILT